MFTINIVIIHITVTNIVITLSRPTLHAHVLQSMCPTTMSASTRC